LSTFVSQPDPTFSWKQEVSRRLAAHQSHKGFSTEEPAASAPGWAAPGSRAALVAARVAARYAQVPSFSQMQTAKSHAARSAAKVAPQAAPKAAAAVQAVVVARHEDAPAAPRQWEPGAPQPLASSPDWEPVLAPAQIAAPASLDEWENACARVQWTPDLSLRPSEPVLVPCGEVIETHEAEESAPPAEERRERFSEESWETEEIEAVEPAQPICANLIEFPRELIATRKMRPHRAERPFAEEETNSELSIFEAEPEAVPTEAASACPESVWSGIELEAESQDEPESCDERLQQPVLQQTPISRRLAAALVDGALIAGALVGPALMAMAKIGQPPAAKILACSAILAFLLAALLYQTLFLTLAVATPGMRCARISFCTFDGRIPTRRQMRRRLGSLLLSVVPVGLGLAWALFDDDHLCWHDRLSRTYLRMD
jgi:uncharacterized RDD family membrane protein YckC